MSPRLLAITVLIGFKEAEIQHWLYSRMNFTDPYLLISQTGMNFSFGIYFWSNGVMKERRPSYYVKLQVFVVGTRPSNIFSLSVFTQAIFLFLAFLKAESTNWFLYQCSPTIPFAQHAILLWGLLLIPKITSCNNEKRKLSYAQ